MVVGVLGWVEALLDEGVGDGFPLGGRQASSGCKANAIPRAQKGRRNRGPFLAFYGIRWHRLRQGLEWRIVLRR